MGMYDVVNGEQAKCFPWVSYDSKKDEIWVHGGSLYSYEIGADVPYKSVNYNYGKNFVILVFNKYPDCTYCNYDYIIHVIDNGIVKDSFTNEIGDIDWENNDTVVGYSGELLSIKNSKNIEDYIASQRKYWTEYEKVRYHWNELFGKSMKCFTGLGLLDKESKERKEREKEILRLDNLMHEETMRIEPELERLESEHAKWFVDTSEIQDILNLGCYISAYYNTNDIKERQACERIITNLLDKDKYLLDRYVDWHESDHPKY